MTKLIALLPLFIGCGPIAVPPSGPAALSDADFDGWQGTASQEKQTIDPAQAGGILSTILDRVESIEAKLRPPSGIKPATHALQPPDPKAAVTRAAPTPDPALDPGQPQRERLFPPPPPAPPAEPLAEARSPIEAPLAIEAVVETLDIPKGWTGAAVYHAATCPHCPPLLAGLRSRASKVVGNYLRIDAPAASWFLLVDWDQRPDLDRPKIGGLPAVLYFVDGHERVEDRVIGFANRPGELDAIIARHPLQRGVRR